MRIKKSGKDAAYIAFVGFGDVMLANYAPLLSVCLVGPLCVAAWFLVVSEAEFPNPAQRLPIITTGLLAILLLIAPISLLAFRESLPKPELHLEIVNHHERYKRYKEGLEVNGIPWKKTYRLYTFKLSNGWQGAGMSQRLLKL